jgi:hypothetical protein
MGNASNGYELVRNYVDPRFGEIKVWKKDSTLVMEKNLFFNDQRELEVLLSTLYFIPSQDYLGQCQLL